MKPKIILLLTITFLVPFSMMAQLHLPDYQTQKVTHKKLYMRWEPRSVTEWENSFSQGYTIKVFSGDNASDLKLEKEDLIKPMPLSAWEPVMKNIQDTLLQGFYEGTVNLMYSSKEIIEGLQQSIKKEEGKTIAETVDEFRLAYLMYGITFDYTLIKMTGTGYDLEIDKNKYYRIEVQSGNNAPFVFNYDPTMKKVEQIPELTAEFGDKSVEVEWLTFPFRNDYYAYYLEISDNGKRFENLSPMPYVNIFDGDDNNEKLQSLKQEFDLEKNYKNYWISVKGMDYFGFKSKKSSVAKGYGFEVIPTIPNVIYANQTEDNQAELKWKIEGKYNRLIEKFQIFRADSLDGEFTMVRDSLSPHLRTIKIPLTEKQNHFSVGLIPKDGPIIRSFPVFVMGQDTVPPITPQNFNGSIDSLGIVTLTWSPNTEEDLWGYKVFRSEYIEDEFACMHASPIRDTFFVDTINLNSINPNMHYFAVALDKRNNRSIFTATITVNRPDTIPPAPPLVKRLTFMEDSIKVRWAASSSDDVVLHQLFRKEIHEEDWLLIREEVNVDIINEFYDKNFEMGKTYAYTALALDKSDLSSLPSPPSLIKTESRKSKQAFANIEVEIDKEQKISTISWDLKDNAELEEIIVYRGKKRSDITMYEIIEAEPSQISQKIKEGEQWFFILNPIFKEDVKGKMSNIIEIKYSE